MEKITLPFVERGDTRTFSAIVDPAELQWHWDEQDRLVSANHETDWKFQYDNRLPQDFVLGWALFIKAGTWHRLIKGTGDLELTIIKG